jgi:hypothetical protein
MITRTVRKTFFITTNVLLRWPVWLALFCVRRFAPFRYVFLVYPGDDSDLDGYCPRWIARSWLFFDKPTLAGFVTAGEGGRGLVLGIPNTVRDLVADPEACRTVLRRLEWVRYLVGARAVAIAGRLPGVIHRHGIGWPARFVTGIKGTVFSIMGAIDVAAARHELRRSHLRIAIVGVGQVGAVLLATLLEAGFDAFGIDPRPGSGQDVLDGTAASAALNSADMVVALTPRGTDFEGYLPHLKPGCIVLDDTHPMIRRRPTTVSFYKVAVEMDGVAFTPTLPGYKPNSIPGCAVEAIVSGEDRSSRNDSQAAFNEDARRIGLRAVLV